MAERHRKPFEEAISKVAFVVDSRGIPQNVCVQKPAGYGLDGGNQSGKGGALNRQQKRWIACSCACCRS